MAALLAIVTDANSYVKDNAAVDALLLKKGATFVTRILRVFGVATQEDFGFLTLALTLALALALTLGLALPLEP